MGESFDAKREEAVIGSPRKKSYCKKGPGPRLLLLQGNISFASSSRATTSANIHTRMGLDGWCGDGRGRKRIKERDGDITARGKSSRCHRSLKLEK